MQRPARAQACSRLRCRIGHRKRRLKEKCILQLVREAEDGIILPLT